jgi:hypothetical protein
METERQVAKAVRKLAASPRSSPVLPLIAVDWPGLSLEQQDLEATRVRLLHL